MVRDEPCWWARRAPDGIWFYVTPEQAVHFKDEPARYQVRLATQAEMLEEVERLIKEVTMPIR